MHWVGVACATVLTLTAMGVRWGATCVPSECGRLRFMGMSLPAAVARRLRAGTRLRCYVFRMLLLGQTVTGS